MAEREDEIVARLRRFHEALNRGDYDEALQSLDDQFELGRQGGQSTVRGAQAVRAWMEPDAMEEQRFEPLEFRVNGDKVYVLTHTQARGAGSGIVLDIEAHAVWTVGDGGKFTSVETFLPHQRDEALRAAGLEEEAGNA